MTFKADSIYYEYGASQIHLRRLQASSRKSSLKCCTAMSCPKPSPEIRNTYATLNSTGNWESPVPPTVVFFWYRRNDPPFKHILDNRYKVNRTGTLPCQWVSDATRSRRNLHLLCLCGGGWRQTLSNPKQVDKAKSNVPVLPFWSFYSTGAVIAYHNSYQSFPCEIENVLSGSRIHLKARASGSEYNLTELYSTLWSAWKQDLQGNYINTTVVLLTWQSVSVDWLDTNEQFANWKAIHAPSNPQRSQCWGLKKLVMNKVLAPQMSSDCHTFCCMKATAHLHQS